MIRGQNHQGEPGTRHVSHNGSMSADFASIVRRVSARGHVGALHNFVIGHATAFQVCETGVSSRMRQEILWNAGGSHGIFDVSEAIGRQTPMLRMLLPRERFAGVGDEQSIIMPR
eukprot:SAG11_NODE_1129_length_5761_cov_296.866302_7_plen_115_part_00